MDQETLKLRRLSAQYLLAPDSRLHVVRAMDGFQAQFLSNAMHAMRLRSADPDAGYAADGLVKSWTLRGTMHLFAEAIFRFFCTTAAGITAGTGRSRPSGTSARTGR